MLDRRYSPDQVVRAVESEAPGRSELCSISHETIYQSLYVYPRGRAEKGS